MRFEDTTLLLGIGMPRTGTGWLHNYLIEHPQALATPIKNMHYFNQLFHGTRAEESKQRFRQRLAAIEDSIRSTGGMMVARTLRPNAVRNLEVYLDRLAIERGEMGYIEFYARRWQGERVLCDVTPEYWSLTEEAYMAMRDIHPDTRILFSVRNPADHWISNIRMRQKQMEPDAFDAYVREVLEAGKPRAANKRIPRAIEELKAVFPDSRRRLVYFETHMTEQGIAEFCDWLGIDRHPPNLSRPVNSSAAVKLDPSVRPQLVRLSAPVYREVAKIMPGELPQSWRRDIDYLDSIGA